MKAEGGAPTDFSVRAYVGVQAFVQAAEGIHDVNNQTILAALSKTTVHLDLFPRPVDFSKPLGASGASQLFNAVVVPVVVKGGHFVADGDPFDAFSAVKEVLGK